MQEKVKEGRGWRESSVRLGRKTGRHVLDVVENQTGGTNGSSRQAEAAAGVQGM